MRMQEAQLSHIRRSMESERARSAAGAARARATELQTQALQLLQETYRDLPDRQQEALELAKWANCSASKLLKIVCQIKNT